MTSSTSLSPSALHLLERILLAPAEEFSTVWQEVEEAGLATEIARAVTSFYRLHLMLQSADGPDDYDTVVRKALHDSAI